MERNKRQLRFKPKQLDPLMRNILRSLTVKVKKNNVSECPAETVEDIRPIRRKNLR